MSIGDSDEQMRYLTEDFMDTENQPSSNSSLSGPACTTGATHWQQMQRSAALLLISMKERYKLTQTTVDFTVNQVQQMVTLQLRMLKPLQLLNYVKEALIQPHIAKNQLLILSPICTLSTSRQNFIERSLA